MSRTSPRFRFGALVPSAAALLTIALLASISAASDTATAATTSHPDSALARIVADLAGEPLRLDQAVRSTLTHATSVGEAEAALRAAQGLLRRERGEFDPELFASVLRSSNDTPTASPFAGAEVLRTDDVATSGGARMRLPFGTELEATIATHRRETNSSFATLDPEYQTTGRVELRQPLLKGFGPAARSDLTSARHNLDAAHASYADARLAARAGAESLYWGLHAAERDLAVQKLIVTQAEILLGEAEIRAAAGLVGPNQVANAQVFLAEQQLAEIDLEERLDGISDALATLMGRVPAAGAVRFHPSDAPPRAVTIDPLETIVSRAHERNRQLRAAVEQLEAARAAARGAGWNALPTLDLVGSFGGSGLSGNGRDVVFGADTLRVDIDGGFGPSWAQVRDHDFPQWSVGIEVSLPLGLRGGRGERDRLRAEVERAEQRVIALRRNLADAVRGSHREITHGARRLAVAERGVAAAYEQVRIGRIEFDNGRTTAFELVRLGADLATAQQRLSAALVRTASALANLRRLTAAEMDEVAAGSGQPRAEDASGYATDDDDTDDMEVKP